MRRRWLPLPVGSCLAKGRPPLQSAPLPSLATTLVAGGSPLQAGRWRVPLAGWPLVTAPCGHPCGRHATSDHACGQLSPLQAGHSRSRSMLGALLWPAAPVDGLAMAGWPLSSLRLL
ncbi:hypothetical protein GW17_00018074 [Ensete ventricosum]|nr:hypothetical protein GW17_00018074 [Ensete ventricosum]RZS25295.1 hypothetical protein BHM03_00058475 [Ensete ventricosum]